ncbi:MAG: amylosucrase [Treponema sp.]|nr:amylosucrase [Treponema sp.]
MYKEQLKDKMAHLTGLLYSLYGDRWDFYDILGRLEKIMKDASEQRSASYLKDDDQEALECEKKNERPWYLRQDAVGMMLYVDLFADDLNGLVKKIPYLKDLGINYVHLMPLFDCPKKENDGGYAISSYRKVQDKLGTMEDLKNLAGEFHKEGIHLVLDFVFNHTSSEHEWAKKALSGDKYYENFYYVYRDKKIVDKWNSSLREIFPQVRRGSFTYFDELAGWVWTTFNSYQWDLNYSNPEVFLAMVEEMLFIANLGVSVLRLDALAFVWKEEGTACESLSKAHSLIKAFECVAKIAAPSLLFKSEAIVHPDQVVQYIGKDECILSYNPLQMALFWNSIATRDTRLLSLSLGKRWKVPEGCAWVNYIRCHDDIGWTFSDEDASSLGINGYNHRQFLNRFFTARFEGSFAKGEAFQLNQETGDCRICGTMASLCGLEEALSLGNELYKKMALERMKMMYATLFALPGIPLLYAGDERAVLNDYSYRESIYKSSDSRWVHRIKTDWERKNECPEQKEFASFVKMLVSLRAKEEMLGGSEVFFYPLADSRVFAFRRNTVHVVANFSESNASFKIDAWSENSTDLLSGKKYNNYLAQELGPYEVRWLKENI